MEILNFMFTGQVPSEYRVDAGKLVGAGGGIFSEKFAPGRNAQNRRGNVEQELRRWRDAATRPHASVQPQRRKRRRPWRWRGPLSNIDFLE